MADTHTGRCYCGAVKIEVRGEPLEMGYCHCENCRRYSSDDSRAATLATAGIAQSAAVTSRSIIRLSA